MSLSKLNVHEERIGMDLSFTAVLVASLAVSLCRAYITIEVL